ncbi:uncharacterized protein K452DRAFT_291677 [Aplosporella prunicola CBS 121167]|uniref:DEUBAD domain-containing protein n=1 Tax=Aplosporella prunicola CBS 121167 TaxID=1176127 RepID=A0A6A6AZC8_9PEZI|nr:uncharacterized protein K452DRAFT_291677 [Aplosporella prunicola CBS 121167]KAF2137269.1 hypothetical protein K452DRAFT_291677 [Aplosporella prunicola CBS 121167]
MEPRTRSRRAIPVKKYVEADSDADFEESSPIIPSTRRGRPQRGAKNADPDFLLQDPSSALAHANVAAILKHPLAWDSLLPVQQMELNQMYPIQPLRLGSPITLPQHSGGMLTQPRTVPQAVMFNTALQSDIALFKEDLECGRLEPEWQQDGMAAMENRARGDFDDWKEQESESFWGQQQRLPYEVLAGESSSVRFDTLVAAGKFRVGDVWTYRRGFGKGAQFFAVDKEATIVQITPDNKLVFTYPPGIHKYSSVYNGPDLTSEPIGGPQPLADALIHADGRNASWRQVNAWKEFRCARNYQDMGTLWEVRELYWANDRSD